METKNDCENLQTEKAYNLLHTTRKRQVFVCTGKPSDVSCLSWEYKSLTDAEKTAEEYFRNYTKF